MPVNEINIVCGSEDKASSFLRSLKATQLKAEGSCSCKSDQCSVPLQDAIFLNDGLFLLPSLAMFKDTISVIQERRLKLRRKRIALLSRRLTESTSPPRHHHLKPGAKDETMQAAVGSSVAPGLCPPDRISWDLSEEPQGQSQGPHLLSYFPLRFPGVCS